MGCGRNGITCAGSRFEEGYTPLGRFRGNASHSCNTFVIDPALIAESSKSEAEPRKMLFGGTNSIDFDGDGDVFETKLLGQQLVFIRGERAITDLLSQPEATEGWWPESVRQLLGSRSLANRNGDDHRARRRVVGQLFSAAALRRYLPEITTLVEELASELGAARPANR